MFQINKTYYNEIYNGFANFTSVFKSPIFVSKPYYSGCDNSKNEQATINNITYLNPAKTSDTDDVDLFFDSYFDVEPTTGIVVSSAHKYLTSVLIEKDDLFDIDSKFIPVYYSFRSGNYTEDAIVNNFSELDKELTIQKVVSLIGIIVTFFGISLFIFSYIKNRMEKSSVVMEDDKLQRLTTL
jgi:hypothetical protein